MTGEWMCRVNSDDCSLLSWIALIWVVVFGLLLGLGSGLDSAWVVANEANKWTWQARSGSNGHSNMLPILIFSGRSLSVDSALAALSPLLPASGCFLGWVCVYLSLCPCVCVSVSQSVWFAWLLVFVPWLSLSRLYNKIWFSASFHAQANAMQLSDCQTAILMDISLGSSWWLFYANYSMCWKINQSAKQTKISTHQHYWHSHLRSSDQELTRPSDSES